MFKRNMRSLKVWQEAEGEEEMLRSWRAVTVGSDGDGMVVTRGSSGL